MKTILSCLKKEYWEERNVLLGLPLGVSALLIASIILSLLVGIKNSDSFDISNISWGGGRSSISAPLGFTENIQSYVQDDSDSMLSRNELDSIPQAKKSFQQQSLQQLQLNNSNLSDLGGSGYKARNMIIGLVFIFISISWFAGMNYLLSSLYSDRKDKTIFFWKSLPVSEKTNVLVKLFFGSFVYTAVAVVVAWITCIVIFGLIFIAQMLFSVEGVMTVALSQLTLADFILLPLAGIFMTALWGLPLFCYILLISALIKRAPFFTAILSPLSIVVVERIVFNSDYFVHFVITFFPFKQFSGANSDDGVFTFMLSTFNGDGLNLIIGLLLSVGCVAAAIWFRDNRFEI